ncbi:hypothetical protein PRZ48_000886 [Zasmidium cellare]|uniref:Uncharacterized protein n=1 Tax=Zasmidium cellare TaxID=395010 RepID=A0ABR0F007_ZASCE|nr:hypothetical protein PRZ48_000886 [Zasmidium cellare]
MANGLAPGAVQYLDACIKEKRPWKTEVLADLLSDVSSKKILHLHGICAILFRSKVIDALEKDTSLHEHGGSVYSLIRDILTRVEECFSDFYHTKEPRKALYNAMTREGIEIVDVQTKALLPLAQSWTVESEYHAISTAIGIMPTNGGIPTREPGTFGDALDLSPKLVRCLSGLKHDRELGPP